MGVVHPQASEPVVAVTNSSENTVTSVGLHPPESAGVLFWQQLPTQALLRLRPPPPWNGEPVPEPSSIAPSGRRHPRWPPPAIRRSGLPASSGWFETPTAGTKFSPPRGCTSVGTCPRRCSQHRPASLQPTDVALAPDSKPRRPPLRPSDRRIPTESVSNRFFSLQPSPSLCYLLSLSHSTVAR